DDERLTAAEIDIDDQLGAKLELLKARAATAALESANKDLIRFGLFADDAAHHFGTCKVWFRQPGDRAAPAPVPGSASLHGSMVYIILFLSSFVMAACGFSVPAARSIRSFSAMHRHAVVSASDCPSFPSGTMDAVTGSRPGR